MTRVRKKSCMPLLWRVFAINAAVIVAAAVVLAATPGQIEFPGSPGEAAVDVLLLASVLALNLVLLRPAFEPLHRLTDHMRSVDLNRPGRRLEIAGRGEVAALVDTFNDTLARLEGERRQSTTLTLKAQEEERRRIARNLHDEIGQTLTAVLLQLDRLRKRVRPELRSEFGDASETVRESLDQVRRIARELRPGVLEDLGLASALRELSTSFSQRASLRIDLRIATSLPPLDADTEVVLYRIAQESLTNVARHARATRAELWLERIPSGVVLRVIDDGRGLDATATGSLGGMRGMREWALLVGGELRVTSGRRGGVQVRLKVRALEPGERAA